jgi:hypothetical protein
MCFNFRTTTKQIFENKTITQKDTIILEDKKS